MIKMIKMIKVLKRAQRELCPQLEEGKEINHEGREEREEITMRWIVELPLRTTDTARGSV